MNFCLLNSITDELINGSRGKTELLRELSPIKFV